jgi:hypothetical protein
MKQQQRRIVLFYSSKDGSSDDILRDRLARALRPALREAHVEEWSDQQILAGADFAQERKRALESATHILLLLSPDYLDSDMCYQEMLDALERQKHGKACVIPILLRPCLLPTILKESLSCLPNNGRPVSKWKKRDQAFFDVARNICQILRLPLASFRRRSSNCDRLLDKVFTYWIEGLLEPSLEEGGTHLDLALQTQPDMIANPWSSQVQELRRTPRPLPTGKSIDRIYDHAHGELLILGEAGAGKTILLLELARTLLERAEKDERTRMPVVFTLSSWAEKRQPLRDWLIAELWERYKVPPKVGQAWIDAGQVIPLLDGLDEVKKEDIRIVCVKAINEYYQWQSERGSSPLVVCCRREEYTNLSTRIMLQDAIHILPLTDEQINSYLEPFEEQVTVLKQSLDEDAELRKLVRQPLWLNFFTLAYQEAQASEIPIGETPEKIRQALFTKYVEHMLKRRERLTRWKQEQVMNWLAFLATQMQRNGQTLFSVEDLQPDWLPEGKYRYLLILNLLVSHPVGWVFGLFVAFLTGSWLNLVYGPPIGLILGQYVLGTVADRIQPAEALGWSWKKFRSGLAASLVLGTLVGLATGELWLPRIRTSQSIFGLLVGVIVGLTVVLFNGLERGVSRKKLVERLSLSPNEGIWRSCKNGLLVGLLIALPVVLIASLFAGLTIGLLFGLLAGLIGWLGGGLFDFVKHFALHLSLLRDHLLPWALVPFLDEMVNRLILHKVGGSYVFVHQLLRDFLASQKVPTSSKNGSSEPSQSGP